MIKEICCKNNDDEQLSVILKEFDFEITEKGRMLTTVLDESVKGLQIDASGEGITVTYSERAFLFRAIGLIAEQTDDEFHIRETAYYKSNGMMIDCSRNAVLTTEKVKELIRYMAKIGMNTLMLYTEDTYEIEGQPYFGYMRGRYTAKELKMLDDYAYGYGIEMIPCIQTLGHMGMVLKWQHYDWYKDTEDILCVEKDRTYDLIRKMISCLHKVFRTDKIHIGMDEAEMIGRGNYYYFNKMKEKPENKEGYELFFEHLNRVVDICTEFGLKPMFWSDMIFKLANGNYRERKPLTQKLIDSLPKNATPIYWEYLREEPEQYDALMKNHLAITEDVIFANGIWKWMGYLPSLTPSMRRIRTSLKVSKQNGIKQVFTTIWGDGGADCPLFALLPGIQLQAELGFAEEISDERLAQRLKTCADATLEDFYILDMPELTEQQNNGLLNPNKYLLFQDALLGLFDLHIPQGTAKKYEEVYQKSCTIAQKEGKYAYMFRAASALYGVLALKAELGRQLKAAYDKKDKKEIEKIAKSIIPELIKRVEYFQLCEEAQWMAENKPFGFEIQDQRIGGLLQRLKTVKHRLEQYLDGEISSVPELEEERLTFGYCKENEFACCNNWSRIVTASYI